MLNISLTTTEISCLISIGNRAATGYYKENPILSDVAKRTLSKLGPQANRIARLLLNQHIEDYSVEELRAYYVFQSLPIPMLLRLKYRSGNKHYVTKPIFIPKSNKGDNMPNLKSSLT